MNIALEIITLIIFIITTFDFGFRCGLNAERRRFTEALIESIKKDLNRRFGEGDTDE